MGQTPDMLGFRTYLSRTPTLFCAIHLLYVGPYTLFRAVNLILYLLPYTCFQKDDTELFLTGEETYHGMTLEVNKEKEDSLEVDKESTDLLSRYHWAVLRNF